ncbi:MAG: choice-of-anchor D domain-containing protein [Ilumatobacteraceae bacterium]
MVHELVASTGDPFTGFGDPTRIIAADTTGLAQGDLVENLDRVSWVATYTGLTPHDVEHAVSVASNSIVWSPAAPGTENTIYEFGEAGGPWTPACGQAAGPLASASSTRVVFPATPANTVLAQRPVEQVTITNDGVGLLADLHITTVTSPGAGFAVLNTVNFPNTCANATVAPGASCSFSVRFNPTVADTAYNATAVVASDSIRGSLVIDLVGSSLAAGSLSAFPATLDFGTFGQGITTPAQSVTVTNIGGNPANLNTVEIIGANAADFVATTNSCGATVASNATCSIAVEFSPSAEGARAATLRLSYDDKVLDIALAGTGLTTNVIDPPSTGVVVSGFISRDFVSSSGLVPNTPVKMQVVRHNVVVGQSEDFVVGADGIAETNHPGGACWVGVTPDIRPGDRVRVINEGKTYQAYMGDIAIDEPQNSRPGVITVHGHAANPDGTPMSLASFAVELITSSANPFDLSGRRIISAPGEGVIEADPVSATNPNGTQFTATWEGLSDADIERVVGNGVTGLLPAATPTMVMLNDTASAETIFEFGEAGGPWTATCGQAEAPSADIAAQAAVDLPTRTIGGSVTRTATVRSTGTAPLTIASTSITGAGAAQFEVTGTTCPAQIAVGTECQIAVTFTPTTVGDQTATLKVFTNVVGTPTLVALHAIASATAEGYATAPADVLFGERGVCNPATSIEPCPALVPTVITVTNDGDAPLNLSTGAITGPDAASFTFVDGGNTCAATVAVGASCTIEVLYDPTAVGSKSAEFVLTPVGATQAPITVRLHADSLADSIYNDPPVSPRAILVFPVRDYVMVTGIPAGTSTIVEVVRNGAVVGHTDFAAPQDDPATTGFDGIIEINHAATVWPTIGWSQASGTPDIRPGDIVRTRVYDDATQLLAKDKNGRYVSDQTMVEDLVLTQRATQTAADTVVVKGYGRSARSGGRLGIGSVEVRLIAAGVNNFDTLGGRARRLLRADSSGTADGVISYVGNTDIWIATFSGLSAHDVALAINDTTLSKSLWLGRNPAGGTEQTHYEWGENAGPQPPFNAGPAASPISSGVAQLTPVMPNIPGEGGLLELGSVSALDPSGVSTLTITNIGTAPMTVSSMRTDLGLDETNFKVAPGADRCSTVTLAVGDTCTIGVRFEPQADVARGDHFGAITIYSDGAHSPHQAILTANVPAVPVISGITPLTAARGTSVTVAGTDLANVTAAAFVNGATVLPATIVAGTNNATSVRVTVPAGAVIGSDYQVRLTTFGGTATSTDTVRITADAPSITTITPTAGAAGTVVTVNGTNFMHDATNLVTGVAFGGRAATNVTVLSATQLRATVAAGSVDGAVTVTTTSGTATGPAFDFYGLPTVVSVTTAAGVPVTSARGGSVVVLNGSEFQGITAMSLNGTAIAANARVVNAAGTTITLTIPAAATNGVLSITARGGTGTSTLLVIAANPTITSRTPTSVGAGLNPPAVVTVVGRNFVGVQEVTVGRTVVPFTVVDANTLRFTVPAGTVTGAIGIRTGFGSVTGLNLTIIPRPVISALTLGAINVNTNLATGRTVTITGTNPTGATSVLIGGRTVTTFTRNTATQVVFVAPVNMLPTQTAVQVTTAGGTGTAGNTFTCSRPTTPAILAANPTVCR